MPVPQPWARILVLLGLKIQAPTGSAVRQPQRARVWHVYSRFRAKPMCDEFPCADITAVLPAGKLGQTEHALLIPHGCFWTCSAEGRAWSKQLREPPFIVGVLFVVDV